VFWNGEFSQTILLKEKGILMPHESPAAADIPAKYRDPEGFWTAFGGRARVILVNTNRMQPADYPARFEDFLDDRYPANQIGMAYPLFGTTATHAAALYAYAGADAAQAFSRLCRTGASASSMAMAWSATWWLMASCCSGSRFR